jgi:serine protease
LTIRPFRLPVLLSAGLVLLLAAASAQANSDGKNQRSFDQFIVQFVPGSAANRNAAVRQRLLDASGRPAGASVSKLRRLAVGADVVHTGRKLDFAAAEAFMNRLRKDPSVKYVEIDRRMHPTFTPNDTFYPNQWHYYEATGGINLPPAWDQSTGTGAVVAVLDTGITPHTDLFANTVAGYDFITSLTTAQDGNARDADPNDPGDYAPADACGVGEPASNSSWHGTHVSGTVAALTNNAKGVAGVAFNARVMPVRVLGRCGGSVSDIADAIVWAAGGAVAGVPTNANPVEVINMSLGGQGSCSATSQQAINFAVAAGTVVVVSAGNDNADATGFEPANCQNVIVVGATGRTGAKSSYSNYGAAVDISAPGGDGADGIASTYNTGTTVQSTEGYAYYQGTSMAAPHVAGTAALMQSANASSPASVESIIKNTARALPVTCTLGCGAGIVNAAAAIGGASTGVLTITDQTLTEGNAGNKNFAFTVNLSKAMPTVVTFNIATANGSASAGSDYTALSLSNQSIPAGATSASFNVAVTGDTSPEAAETFFVNVSNVVGIAVADAQGLGVIQNDDPIPLVNNVTVPGLSATTGQTLLYSLTVPAGKTSVAFDTSGGTGDADLLVKFGSIPTAANADCISQGATTVETCSFVPPQAGTYYVVVLAYTDISGVSLTGKYLPLSTGVVPEITITDSVTTEGASGTKLSSFTVNLSAASDSPVVFDLVSTDGSAIAGSDYAALALYGQSIAAGSTSKSFAVTINGDTAVERNEYYYIRVGNVQGATYADRVQGMGVISNDDYPLLTISPVAIPEGNSGTSSAWFTIDMSAAMDVPVTMDVTTSNGSGAAGSDYQARSVPGLVMPAGQTRLSFAVQVIGDTVAEADETFNVSLSNPVSATLGNGVGVGTISNDDGAPATGVTASASAAAVSTLLVPAAATSVPGGKSAGKQGVRQTRAKTATR